MLMDKKWNKTQIGRMISFLCFKVIWMLQNFHFLRGISEIFKIAGRLIVTCTNFGRLIVTLSTFAKLISVLINKKHKVFSRPIPISVLTYTWLHSSVINTIIIKKKREARVEESRIEQGNAKHCTAEHSRVNSKKWSRKEKLKNKKKSMICSH